MARRAAIASGLLLLALFLSACTDQEEARKQQLIRQQITTVERQLAEINGGHDELQARVNRMRELLAAADTELAKSDARVFGINAIIPYLRQLTLYGFGETPAQYIVRNPDLGPGVLVPALLFLLFLWMMWRIRQGQLQRAMSAEIDRVIRRLSAETANAAANPANEAASGPRAARRAAPPEQAPAADARGPAPEKTGASAAAAGQTATGPRRPAESPASAPGARSGPAPRAAAQKPARKAPAAPARPRTPSSRQTAGKKGDRPAMVKRCRVKGCNNKHRSKGYCNKHYQQWRKGVLREEVEE